MKTKFNCLLCISRQNRQSPGVTLSTTAVTKHLSNLSLDSQKKVTASPEFVPGRGLSSNSSSPNLFNNSYHLQENVGGTTYFYLGNAANDSIGSEEGTETVRNFRAQRRSMLASAC